MNLDQIRPATRLAIALGLLSVVLLPRVWHLENKSLWFDEAASWRTSSFSLPEMLKSLAGNVHTPLYYLVLKAWRWFWGDAPTALRSCSVVWGIAAVGMTGALVGVGSGSQRYLRAGMAMALYGVSPLAVRYSREAVMYTLATSLVLGSAWLLLIAQRREQNWYLWISSALLAAGVYTHHYVLLYALAHSILVVWPGAKRLSWQRVLIAVLPFVLFLPWIPTFWGQLRLVDSGYWIAPITWQRAGNLLWQLWAADDVDGATWRPALGWALSFVAVFASWRWGGEVGRLATVHFSFVVALAFVASVMWRSIVMPRYFAPAHAILVCGLAAALPTARTTGRLLAVFLLGGLLVLLARLWPRLDPGPSHGLHSAVTWVVRTRSARDVVLVTRPFLYLPWRYYDRDGQVYLTADGVNRLSHYEGLPLLAADEREPGEKAARLAPAVWFVRGPDSSLRPEFLGELGWTRTKQRSFSEAFPWQSSVTVERFEMVTDANRS